MIQQQWQIYLNYYQRMEISSPKKSVNRDKCVFHDKTAYVWGLRYRWDPLLSRNLIPRFPHFKPPCDKDQWKDSLIRARVRGSLSAPIAIALDGARFVVTSTTFLIKGGHHTHSRMISNPGNNPRLYIFIKNVVGFDLCKERWRHLPPV